MRGWRATIRCILFLCMHFQTALSEVVMLREWLQKLEVTVPPFPIWDAVSRLGFDANVTGGSCRGLNVEEVLLTDAVAEPTYLKVALQVDLGFRCLVEMMVGENHPCAVNVATAASVVKLDVQVPSAGGLPGPTSVSCRLIPDVTVLKFSSRSLACDTLRLAEQALRALINDFASSLLCTKASAWLRDELSKATELLRKTVLPYMKPSEVLPLPVVHDAVDLQSIFWKGPVGHVCRSFLQEVGHVDDNDKFNKVVRFLRTDLGLNAVPLPVGSGWQVAFPWIDNMVLALALRRAHLDVSSIEDVHFQFSAESAARLAGTATPSVGADATISVLLPTGTATLKLLGRDVNISQGSTLSPLHLRAKLAMQVKGATTGFIALNHTGLQRLQLDQMQTAGCASTFLDRESNSPVKVLEARCAPHLMQLNVELPGGDPESLENHLLEAGLTVLQLMNVTFGNASSTAFDGFISGQGREVMNRVLDRTLFQQSECPASNYSSGEIGALAMPSGFGSAVFLVIAAVLFVVSAWPFCGRAAELAAPQERILQVEDGAWTPSTSSPASARGLGWHPAVSVPLRWGILCGIVGTISLFIYASVTPGILLSGSFKASDGSSDTKHMASLSMDNSLVQTWSVKSYFVFAAMLIFSVIWPYVKLLLMLYVWIKPMDGSVRGPLLMFLDQIGKWSLMDNIILFLFIVFFWVAWTGEDIVGGGRASFGLKCSPQDELNTFLAATILSLLLGHVMLWIHRSQMTKNTETGLRESFWRNVTGAGHILCLLLMVLSWQVEIVEVTFSGLVGTFLKVTDQPTTKRYSILGILSCLGKQGSAYLQVTFAIFVLVIPVLQLLVMTFICLYKLHPGRRQQLLRLCYTLKAWSAFDVFLVAFLAGVLGGDQYGIGQFIELIVYKQNLAPTCRGLRQAGIECLHIHLGFLPGTLGVVAAVAVSYAVSCLAVKETHPT
mmetsp:Transcript_55448/g.104130  ORF Transcript_55448/g.104130 Transcript_55448/m.104130 type:complete len:953 (+) Transcript_55448:36-2894(+)